MAAISCGMPPAACPCIQCGRHVLISNGRGERAGSTRQRFSPRRPVSNPLSRTLHRSQLSWYLHLVLASPYLTEESVFFCSGACPSKIYLGATKVLPKSNMSLLHLFGKALKTAALFLAPLVSNVVSTRHSMVGMKKTNIFLVCLTYDSL